ncbi:hypothetical protein EV702DRAFT_1070814 [Suillus placidus]|uniref:DUF6533 domain-containing protein n=1 Tax=Suillus placidus TaxID=48579 RepID=A0A9P7D7T7_9AGAM|nr:hypothetical protein EV702DRAFT_1070814 [Suillus placidus]
MTVISNDPSWWPPIKFNLVFNYFAVTSFTAVVYDWVVTFGKEFESVWRKRCSLMSVLYVSVRYLGILYVGYDHKADEIAEH